MLIKDQDLQYARSLIEASLDPLVTISIEGKITDMNQATIDITGINRELLTGTDFFTYFTEPQKAREVYQEVFANGFVADSPLTLRHKNGKLTTVLFNGSVYRDEKGLVQGVVIVARDVTEQNKIKTELIEAKVFAELATEIAEDAKLNAENATHIATNAVKAKQQFLSNMSHEIRTPMNAIIGFTKVLLKSEITTKQKEYLDAIKTSGDALIVLINDILDLAKVDAGKMVFEQTPFKISSSIASMLHLFETKIHEKNLKLLKSFDARIPEILLGDSVRLHQIILNLVSNAVKFTSKGTITICTDLKSESSSAVEIEFTIKDTGIGIPKSKIAKIFENFQQATSGTSRIYGGTGLGLAIVKQLVEGQGGRILVTSELGIGTSFSFILSFNKTNLLLDLVQPNLELEKDVKNIKVLVVEDIVLNQLLMKTVLDEFGFERVIAENGKIAIQLLEKELFDIILMDLQMPEMNGFEATEYIRNQLHLNIPIIALTADVTTVDINKCKEVGMNDYLSKPIDERLLYNKIIGLVSKPIVSNDFASNKYGDAKVITPPKYVNLSSLSQRTKENKLLMIEMIEIYIEQTPHLIKTMKQSLFDRDWLLLKSALHKIIPSFSIMGIDRDYENMARRVHDVAHENTLTQEINNLVLELENVCNSACEELELELIRMKKQNEKGQ
jgi:PAS domain S-box-containing protein